MDQIPTQRMAGRRSAQDAVHTPNNFDRLVDRLAGSASRARERLRERLYDAVDQHDLDKRELMSAQRDVRRLHRIGIEPSPTEYWQRTAVPRAAIMVNSSMAALVDEGERLGGALDRFVSAIDDSELNEWAETAIGRASVTSATADAVEQLLGAVPSDQAIHDLGDWWQQRLRTAAMRHAWREALLTRGDIDIVIGRAEMTLLDRPPWSHGDRLLSAFEVAHGEIRTQTELVVEGLLTRVATRGRRYLAPNERVTIELRERVA